MFDSLLMRINLIYVALTKRYFVCAAYNKIDWEKGKICGGKFVGHYPAEKKDMKVFAEAVSETLDKIVEEDY